MRHLWIYWKSNFSWKIVLFIGLFFAFFEIIWYYENNLLYHLLSIIVNIHKKFYHSLEQEPANKSVLVLTESVPVTVSWVKQAIKWTLVDDQTSDNSMAHQATVKLPVDIHEKVAESAAKLGLSPKDFTEQAIQSFLEGMVRRNNTPASNYIHELGMEQLQKHILKKIAESQRYTSGTEGDIYRLEINGKDCIIVKKRFHISEKEHIFQKKAYDIAKKLSEETGNIVAVPELFSHFIDGTNEYIVMEYVQGKTLYALILEQLVTKILLPILEKSWKDSMDYSYSTRLQEFLTHYSSGTKQWDLDFIGTNLSSFYSRFEKSSRVHFSNDTDAEIATLELYNLLYDIGLITENPNQTIVGYGSNPFLTKEYKKHFSQLGLFQEWESIEIRKNLRIFLQELHTNQLYHRDIGGNPRNIIFGKDGKIYVIDFGKGIEISSSASVGGVYYDQLHDGNYDNDMDVLPLIDKLTKSSELSEGDRQRESLSVLEKNLPIEQIHKIAQKFEIPTQIVDSACHLWSGVSIKGIIAGLDRLLIQNDRIFPDEYIHYPKLFLAGKFTIRMKPASIHSTYKGWAKLLVNLFLLSSEDKELLMKSLEKKRLKYVWSKKKLLYIDMYTLFLQKVLTTQ